MTDVAVIFGGPSPEHDVSVLTGLQAARGLRDVLDGYGRHRPRPVRTKTGDWFEVDPGLEAESFVDGVPGGADDCSSWPPPVGGSRARGAARTVAGPGRRCGPGLLSRGAGRGRHPAGRFGPGRHSLHRSDRGRRRSGHGQTGLRLGGGRSRPAHPAPAVAGGRRRPAALRRPFIVKPRFGGSSIGIDVVQDFGTAVDRLAVNPHLRFGAVLEPYHPEMSDLQIGVRTWPTLELSAVERPIRSTGAADILDYRDKYVAGEGMVGANRELPAQIPPNWRRDCDRRRRGLPRWPASGVWPVSIFYRTGLGSWSTRSTPSRARWPGTCG